MSTFSQLFKDAANALSPIFGESATFEARLLLCHFFGIDESKLLLNMNEEAGEENAMLFCDAVNRRLHHTPIQYILGRWEFMGLPFFVNENVLIPRSDTETLVIKALDFAKGLDTFSLLDLCCGSGIIGLAIKKLAKANVDLTLADISDDALSLSRKNADSLSLDAQIIKTDMFSNIQKTYDFIVCNPPYIQTDVIKTLDEEVKKEPHLALDGGRDGLDFYRIISGEYKRFLNAGGKMLLEIGYDQGVSVSSLFEKSFVIKDLSGNDRVVVVENS
ncbi:MAG: peptide chain release factor N(5)-glutamine methyltransferase [Clostridia bacterium]|nr:peptide chain release factor N(5)-glutamine methyltransferase [Clostridia bacterium]